MSAPCSMGLDRIGANVLSMTSGRPLAWAASAMAPMSGTSSRGIADGLDVVRLGAVVRLRDEVLRRVALDPAHLDPEAGQGVLEQVVRPAVQAGGRDEVVARTGEVEDRQRLGRLPRREAQRGDPALDRGDALLEDVRGRVHDPGVDVPELLEREQPCGVIGVVEVVGARGVDRDRPRPGRRVGLLAGMQGQGLGEQGALRGAAVAVAVVAHGLP